MSTARMTIPLWCARSQEGSWVASPLLMPELRCAAPTRPAACLAVRRRLSEELSQHNPLLLRRLCAMPDDWREVATLLELNTDRGRITHKLLVVSFSAGGAEWAVLPLISRAVLPLSDDGLPYAVRLQSGLDHLLRQAEESPVLLEELRRWELELVEPLRLKVELAGPPMEQLSLQMLLGGAAKREPPAAALAATSRLLNDLYPDELLADLEPDPRVDRLYAACFGAERESVALVGPPGSGRSTLLQAALRRRIEERESRSVGEGGEEALPEVPQVWHLNPNRVIAGQSMIGAWQQRFAGMLDLLPASHRRRLPHVLFVDQPVALARAGRYSGSDMHLGTVLRPYLAQRRFPMVIEASPEEWARLEELDRSLTELFTVMRLAAPPPERARRMFLRSAAQLELRRNVLLDTAGLRRIIELDALFPLTRVAPGSMMERLQAVLDRVPDPGEMLEEEVDRVVEAQSGLQQRWLDPLVCLEPAELLAELRARLVGQEGVAEPLVDALLRLKAGLSRPGRPLLTALLVGPTGVGKTEAARVLAGMAFTDPATHLIRLDMNEYADATAVSRLIGEGDRGGLLTGPVRERPHCLLLLDEIEKAHPSVHDLLLQVLDEGRLTDAEGRAVDLTRALILMTSNVGAAEQAAGVGFSASGGGRAGWRGVVERAFRPEFINRIDQILIFEALNREQLRRVARLHLERVLGREGFLRRLLFAEVDGATLDSLVELALGETGARALKRGLERQVVQPLAARLALLPADQPQQVLFTGGRLEVRPIPFARAESPALSWPGLEELRRRVEALRQAPGQGGRRDQVVASVGPDGQTWVADDLLSDLLDRLEAARPSEEVVEAEPALTAHQLRGLAGRWSQRESERQRDRVRSLWRVLPEWSAMDRYPSLRAFLIEQSAPGPEGEVAVPDPVQRLVAHQLRAVEERRPSRIQLRLRPLGSLGAEGEATLKQLREQLHELARTMGAEVQQQGERLSVEGPGMPELWRVECGVQIVLPQSGAPIAVLIQEEGQPPRLEVVRQRMLPGPGLWHGRVVDQRLGEAGELGAPLGLEWALRLGGRP